MPKINQANYKQKPAANRKVSHKDYTLKELLAVLPRKTYNCNPFGLMLMVNSTGWNVSYYSHFTKTSDDRIPLTHGRTPESVLYKLYLFMKKNNWKTVGTLK